MRLILVLGSGPTVGMEYCEVLGIYPNDTSDSEVLMEARDFAMDRVSSYMDIVEHEPDWEGEEEYSYLSEYCYEEDINYWVEDYVPETHDILRAGGGYFKEDFKNWE